MTNQTAVSLIFSNFDNLYHSYMSQSVPKEYFDEPKYLQFEEEETEDPEQSELVTIVLPRTIAKAVYEALKLSLNE